MAPRPTRERKPSILSSRPSPAPSDVSSVISVATPIPKPKKEKVKADKVEKAKAPPKVKAEKKETKVKVEKKDTGKEKETKDIGKDTGKSKVGKDEKEKIKPVTGDEAQEVLLKYLVTENRPFSAGDISGNLHGKVTKTLADKLLKEMANNNLIMGKGTNGDAKGSQWVYWAIQDPSATCSPEELSAMDDSITQLRAKIPGLKGDLKALGLRLNTLRASMTKKELEERIKVLREEKMEKENKLKGLRGGKQVTREEAERVEKEWVYWGKKSRERKRAFEEVEGLLLEGMGKEEVWERAGIEGDE